MPMPRPGPPSPTTSPAPPGRHHHAAPRLPRWTIKDPLPLLAQIHTDLFQPGEASSGRRAGAQRMPYLRSPTSWPTTRRAAPSLGAALAFFGMEDWALELARRASTLLGAAATCSWRPLRG